MPNILFYVLLVAICLPILMLTGARSWEIAIGLGLIVAMYAFRDWCHWQERLARAELKRLLEEADAQAAESATGE